MNRSVLVALSGGIDSSIAAVLLKQKGYHVKGVHFNFFPGESDQKYKLSEISSRINIPVLSCDAGKIFEKEVIDYFTRSHLSGHTPSPCVRCNPNVKYKLLAELADQHGMESVSTGHYIRLKKEGDTFRLYKAADINKDQSYYLWGLKQDVTRRLITPLGEYSKEEVQQTALRHNLGFLTERKESTGLCFARGRTCSEMLLDHIPGLQQKIKHGKVVDKQGRVIGRHSGYVYYTIGQKKNLELNDKRKELCVVKIDPENNILVADKWESLFLREFIISGYHFINPADLHKAKTIQVRVRGFGLNPPGNCRLEYIDDRHMKIYLDEPAWAVAPGQPAVFYSGDLLLGGGYVVESMV